MDIDLDVAPDSGSDPPLIRAKDGEQGPSQTTCLCGGSGRDEPRGASDNKRTCGGTTEHCLRPYPPASPPVFDAENPFLNQATYLRILDIQHDDLKSRLDKLVRKQRQRMAARFDGSLDPTVTVREPCWGKYDKEVPAAGGNGIHFMVSDSPVRSSEDEDVVMMARPLWIPDTPDMSPSSSAGSTPLSSTSSAISSYGGFSSAPSLTDSPISHATTPSPPLLDVASYKLLPQALVSSEGKMSQKAGITKKKSHQHLGHHHSHHHSYHNNHGQFHRARSTSPNGRPKNRSRSSSPVKEAIFNYSSLASSTTSSSTRSSIRITTLWKSDDPKFGLSLVDEVNGVGRVTHLNA